MKGCVAFFLLCVIVLVLMVLGGCVTISTSERRSQDRYVDGQRDAYKRIMFYSETKTLEDTRWLIEGALAVLGDK